MPILAHKIELQPNQLQESYFRQCAGAARFFYNRSLATWKGQYESGGKPSEAGLRKQFTEDKKIDPELSWSNDIPAAAITNAIRNLGLAFKNFFQEVKKGKPSYPRFKCKGRSKESFNPWDGGRINLDENYVQVPKLGWVKMRETLRFAGRLIQGVISQKAGKWFLTITVETETPAKEMTGSGSVGLDLGCKDMAVTSNGQKFAGPKPLRVLMRRLRRLSRRLSRKMKGGKNRAKAKQVIAALHYRITCIRDDFQHKLSTALVLKYSAIAIEDLNVEGMAGLRTIRKSLADQRLGTFRRMLEYKSKLYGTYLHVVDRYFPSSKTCSCCGKKKDDLKLSDRVFTCDCGFVIDRDINAAINLEEQIPPLGRDFKPMETGQ